jgi:pimeloyl-ACP methyl ester carboxylesterase
MLLTIVAAAAAVSAAACPSGIFKAPRSNEQVVVTPPRSGAQRYTYIDGRRGDFADESGPLACSDGKIVSRNSGAIWTEVPLRRTEVSFRSHDQRFSGALVEPSTPGPRPLVVFVHGSERTSPMEGAYPYVLAAHGLAVFAYDKRGTGGSEGEYTQNFELLADDAAAAMAEARRVATARFTRAGFFGGSQGGWIAPLAATRSQADFVAIGFGLLASPLEEDREQVLTEMRARGHGEPDLSQALELADAAGAVVASHFTSGFGTLAELKRRYAAKPWFSEIKGEFTGAVVRASEADLRRIGRPLFDNLELIWGYDASAVLRRLKAPLLWIIAEQDREAPPDTSLRRLDQLRAEGLDVTVFSFPETDHGMVEFTKAPDGSRKVTRVTEGYFRLLADWIKGRLGGPYGRARRR